MAMRLRTVHGVRVALCAVETDGLVYEPEWAAMDTQKVRDARVEFNRWEAERNPGRGL
jgi:hypothetical protein